MHNPFRAKLRIGLSKNSITLLHTGSVWRARDSILGHVAGPAAGFHSIAEMGAQLRSALDEAKCRGLATAMIVADEWVRYFMATPPHQVSSMQDCRAATLMRFQALYGEPAEGWRLEADWHAERPFLVCAMPSELIAVLDDAASTHKLRLTRITPQFIAAWSRWNRQPQPGAWFGTVYDSHLTLGIIEGRELRAVRSHVFADEAAEDPHWLAGHVSREALRSGVAAPSHIRLCGNVPPGWASGKGIACEHLGAPGAMPIPPGIMLARMGMYA